MKKEMTIIQEKEQNCQNYKKAITNAVVVDSSPRKM